MKFYQGCNLNYTVVRKLFYAVELYLYVVEASKMNVVYVNTLSVEDYCRLRESVDFYAISECIVKKALEKSDFIISAIIDDITVGMGRLITDGTQVLIIDVVVHPDFQGYGIGRSIMVQINQHIKSEYDQMLVNLLTDETKIDFYKKFGYNIALGMRWWYGI